MSTESKVPQANEVGQFFETCQQEAQSDYQTEPTKPILTDEEREARRTDIVRQSCQGCRDYVLDKAVGKILNRHREGKGDCYIFKYSAPGKRGLRTKFFSQWVFDQNTGQCYPDHYRPPRHANNLWYFPIIYLMNGKSKNEKRTFENLGLESVQQMLKHELNVVKGYHIEFQYRHATGNAVYVKWADPAASTDQSAASTDQSAASTDQSAASTDQSASDGDSCCQAS